MPSSELPFSSSGLHTWTYCINTEISISVFSWWKTITEGLVQYQNKIEKSPVIHNSAHRWICIQRDRHLQKKGQHSAQLYTSTKPTAVFLEHVNIMTEIVVCSCVHNVKKTLECFLFSSFQLSNFFATIKQCLKCNIKNGTRLRFFDSS